MKQLNTANIYIAKHHSDNIERVTFNCTSSGHTAQQQEMESDKDKGNNSEQKNSYDFIFYHHKCMFIVQFSACAMCV